MSAVPIEPPRFYRPLIDYEVGERALVSVDDLDYWGTVVGKTNTEVTLGWRNGEHHPPIPNGDGSLAISFPYIRSFRSNYETGEVEGVLQDYAVGARVRVLYRGNYFWGTVCDRVVNVYPDGPGVLIGWTSSATDIREAGIVTTRTSGNTGLALEAHGQTHGLFFPPHTAVQKSEREPVKKDDPTPHWTKRLTGDDAV